MMLLMIDNYDSFTFNLVQYFGELGQEVGVPQRRDHGRGHRGRTPTCWCCRPGPARRPRPGSGRGHPALRGASCPSWACAWATRHRRGVGRQASCAAAAADARQDQHVITTTQQGVFAGLPAQFTVNRYHSLAIERATCPDELEVTAWTGRRRDHGRASQKLPIQGVQFHPESILTEHGHAMLKNFLEQV
jgi:anthranilate synthase component 2